MGVLGHSRVAARADGRVPRRGRSSFPAAAGRVLAPTLVVWGTRDRLVDVRLAPRTVAAFAQADLLVLPGCGHVAQMEDPKTTARGVLALWERSRADGADELGAEQGDVSTTRMAPAGAPLLAGQAAVATSWT